MNIYYDLQIDGEVELDGFKEEVHFHVDHVTDNMPEHAASVKRKVRDMMSKAGVHYKVHIGGYVQTCGFTLNIDENLVN